MSDITDDLYTQLSSASTPAGARIYPLVAATPLQAAGYPFVTYQCLASPVENILDGNGAPPINNTRFQIDCYDRGYKGVRALTKAIIAALQAWGVQNTVQTSPEDFYESEIQAYREMFEVSVWHYD